MSAVIRKAEAGRAAIGRLCQHMRKVSLFVQNGSSMPVTLGWIEQLPSFLMIFVHMSNMVVGENQYQHLSFVAKAALTLLHSNASPKWGFLVNNALVTEEKGSLSERNIVALRVVKEAICLAPVLKFP